MSGPVSVACPAGCDPATTYDAVGKLAGHLIGHPHVMNANPALDKARELFTKAAVNRAVPSYPAEVPVPGEPRPDPGKEPAMTVRADKPCQGCGKPFTPSGARSVFCPKCAADTCPGCKRRAGRHAAGCSRSKGARVTTARGSASTTALRPARKPIGALAEIDARLVVLRDLRTRTDESIQALELAKIALA